MKDNSKLITSLLTGMAVGAFLGVILAPCKGQSSRNKVDLFFTNLSDTLIDNAENQINLLGNLKDGLRYSIKKNLESRANRS
jgi:gas vesicle protein